MGRWENITSNTFYKIVFGCEPRQNGPSAIKNVLIFDDFSSIILHLYVFLEYLSFANIVEGRPMMRIVKLFSILCLLLAANMLWSSSLQVGEMLTSGEEGLSKVLVALNIPKKLREIMIDKFSLIGNSVPLTNLVDDLEKFEAYGETQNRLKRESMAILKSRVDEITPEQLFRLYQSLLALFLGKQSLNTEFKPNFRELRNFDALLQFPFAHKSDDFRERNITKTYIKDMLLKLGFREHSIESLSFFNLRDEKTFALALRFVELVERDRRKKMAPFIGHLLHLKNLVARNGLNTSILQQVEETMGSMREFISQETSESFMNLIFKEEFSRPKKVGVDSENTCGSLVKDLILNEAIRKLP